MKLWVLIKTQPPDESTNRDARRAIREADSMKTSIKSLYKSFFLLLIPPETSSEQRS
jgi:hypothetical protein